MSDYTPPPIPNSSHNGGGNSPSNKVDILALLALIIGAVAILLALIPGVSLVAFLPAIAAVVLGILALALKKQGKTQSIVGLSLGAASVLIALITSVIFFAPSSSSSDLASPIVDESVSASEPVDDTSESLVVPEPETEPAPPVSAGIPAGFEDGGAGVAWRFVDDSCVLWDYCVIVELYAYEDCPGGVDVEGNEIDYDTDTIFDATYESTGTMYAGDTAVVELGILNPRANGVQLTDIICYY